MRKSHEERRLEIIQSALKLAAERGTKKVTTQAIAERVGIAQPTIFRHFKTRDEIFAGAIGWLAENLFRVLDESLAETAPPDERLRHLLQTQLTFVSKHKGLPRMLFSDRLHLESPVLKKTVRRVMEAYMKRVAQVIQEGIDQGCFNAQLDADEGARMVAAAVQGTLVRWSIYDFRFSLKAEIEPLWRFIYAGLQGAQR